MSCMFVIYIYNFPDKDMSSPMALVEDKFPLQHSGFGDPCAQQRDSGCSALE